MALRKLGPTTNPEVSLPWDTVRDALDHMVQAAASHVDKEHFLVLWESLQVRINSYTAVFLTTFSTKYNHFSQLAIKLTCFR